MSKLAEARTQLSQNKISRRDFLKTMVALGLSTPAVAAFLSACAPQAVPATATSEAFSMESLLAGLTQADTQAAPLVADGWSYLPEVVLQMQDIFMQQYAEKVNFEVIPGDYSATMLNKMIAKAPVDVMYSKLEATKFMDAGWIAPISDLMDVEPAKKDMLPVFRDALTYKGKLYGLPYNCGAKGMAAYNRLVLEQVGISREALPKTWDELYALCAQLKADGAVEIPIVMLWTPNSDGIVHNWQAESMNRGDPMIDESFEVVFDENSGAAQTLAAWNKLWTDELVPADNLVLGFVDARDVFATGKAAFITVQSWHLKTLNNPQNSNVAGNVLGLPYVEQPWGLFDYAGYAVVNRPEQPQRMARAARWANFMGYRDANAEILVGKQWVVQGGLGTAYPEVYAYPDVEESYKTWMPEFPYLRDVIADNLVQVKPFYGWKALWYPEWGAYAATVLPDAITGKRSVTEVINDLRTKWADMRKPYGG